MNKSIAVLPGDGVGPEIIEQAIKILKKIGQIYHHEFRFQYGLIGSVAIDETGDPLPEETLDLCMNSDAVLFGAIGDPKYDMDPNAKVRPEQGLLKLRKRLGLYANLRPVKIYKELTGLSPLKNERLENVDILIVRELIGGIYFGEPRKRLDMGKTAVDTSVYTKEEITKVARLAFKLSMSRRKIITSVDKANVLETSRLWRETINGISQKNPEICLTHMFVDNASMQLIKKPSLFDVILTENMFGDILSDEASVLAGSIGLLPSASLGDQHALFEPIHGAFNKAAGKNIANPIGTILSAAMMLRFSFDMESEAKNIETAVGNTIKTGFRTKDISSLDTPPEQTLGTAEFGDKVTGYLVEKL